MQTFLTVWILIITILITLRMNKNDKYNKWSGGVFIIKGDDSLMPLDFSETDAKLKEDIVVKGIYIGGAKKENMPFVDYMVYVKQISYEAKPERVLLGRKITEDGNGVAITFAESFQRGKYGNIAIEICANHPWNFWRKNSLDPYRVGIWL